MAQRTSETVRLLLVVDGSRGSQRTAKYVGTILKRRRGFHIHLLHLLPPLPRELLEFGGAENPQEEQQLETELRRDQKKWIASARASAQPTLEEAMKMLRRAGIAGNDIACSFSYPTEPHDAARVVLEQGRTKNCHTVVLGHKAHSWFLELVGGHLAEHLLREARGLTIWVVQ